MDLLEELRELRIAHALLEEQLKEAKEVIKTIDNANGMCTVKEITLHVREYLEKYKDES